MKAVDAAKRREYIVSKLRGSQKPVSATALGDELSVSRQIIVGDIALLRAAGERIMATPRGYVLEEHSGDTYTLACIHGVDDTEKELNIMVDNGCTVLNVTVEHQIYGQLTGQLQLANRYDVSQFIKKLYEGGASPLSTLTGGIHLHSLACPDAECFERTKEELRKAGFLYTEQQF